jgi:uncharacterized membrane protein YjjB (DUF3815 family)
VNIATVADVTQLSVTSATVALLDKKRTRPYGYTVFTAAVGLNVYLHPTLTTAATTTTGFLIGLLVVGFIGGKVSQRTFHATLTPYILLPLTLWLYPAVGFLAMVGKAFTVTIKRFGAPYAFMVAQDSVTAIGVNPVTFTPTGKLNRGLIPVNPTQSREIHPHRYIQTSLWVGILFTFVRGML